MIVTDHIFYIRIKIYMYVGKSYLEEEKSSQTFQKKSLQQNLIGTFAFCVAVLI